MSFTTSVSTSPRCSSRCVQSSMRCMLQSRAVISVSHKGALNGVAILPGGSPIKQKAPILNHECLAGQVWFVLICPLCSVGGRGHWVHPRHAAGPSVVVPLMQTAFPGQLGTRAVQLMGVCTGLPNQLRQ